MDWLAHVTGGADRVNDGSLHDACMRGDTAALAALLAVDDAGKAVNPSLRVNEKDQRVSSYLAGYWEWQPLHYAAYYGKPEAVRMLAAFSEQQRQYAERSAPGDIDSDNDDDNGDGDDGDDAGSGSGGGGGGGATARRRRRNNKRSRNHLLLALNSHEAAWGYTPLHYAVERGQADTVQALVEAGASLDVHTLNGVTPLQLAEKLQGQSYICELLGGAGDAALLAGGTTVGAAGARTAAHPYAVHNAVHGGGAANVRVEVDDVDSSGSSVGGNNDGDGGDGSAVVAAAHAAGGDATAAV